MAEAEIITELAILGSGPCGLGAAWRVARLAPGTGPEFLIIDRNRAPGGSAASVTTPEGFTFDYGGHVLYPHEHYSDFKNLLDDLVPEWHESKPIRGVWIDGRLIPYPVQRNLHRLRVSKMLVALWGLVGVRSRERFRRGTRTDPGDLERFLQQRFGHGLTRVALAPINRKMWAHELSELGSGWTSQRSGSKLSNVSGVSVREVLSSVITRRDNLGWTESTRVRYPAHGGTGSIWTSLAARFKERRLDGETVVGIDDRRNVIQLASGARVRYDRMISTLPLDVLVELIENNDDISSLGKQLRYAQAGFVGFGFRGPQSPVLAGVHSFHIPQTDIDCWRVTIPSNVAPGNAPPGDFWSILCEISAPLGKRLDILAISDQMHVRLRAAGLVPRAAELVSRWSATMQHGYPIPFVGRDAVLQQINTALWRRGILSRGRFGGWKYEVSNQDHSFMQGFEAVDFLYGQRPETTYCFPEVVN